MLRSILRDPPVGSRTLKDLCHELRSSDRYRDHYLSDSLAQNPLKPNGGIAKDFEKFIADLNAQFRRLTGQTSSSSLASPGTVADVDAASAAHEARLQAGYEAGHAEDTAGRSRTRARLQKGL